MVSKCANPECAVPFRYFHQGKLFRLENRREPDVQDGWKKPSRRLEFFWLCPDCARKMTITAADGGVSVRPRPTRAAAA